MHHQQEMHDKILVHRRGAMRHVYFSDINFSQAWQVSIIVLRGHNMLIMAQIIDVWTGKDFDDISCQMARRCQALSLQTQKRRYKSLFGCSSEITAKLWNLLLRLMSVIKLGCQPQHLLWTLLFLKQYASETVLCELCGCDEKTLRKWVWLMLDMIVELKPHVVSSNCLILFNLIILTYMNIMSTN